LKQVLSIENSITAPLQNLEFIIQPFNKAAVGSVKKVLGDFFPPLVQRFQEVIETYQPTTLNTAHPGPDFAFCNRGWDALVKEAVSYWRKS